MKGHWVFNDGGRVAAGYKGFAGDCVVRAIAIAMERTYADVYDAMNDQLRARYPNLIAAGKITLARKGVLKIDSRIFIEAAGWLWTPTMRVGAGTTVHLRAEELPPGRLIVSCSRHMVAVIDGIVHDTYDSTRRGTRCVYGYWRAPQ